MCSHRHPKQRSQPSGAAPTARPSKGTISSVTRAWSGMTTLKPQQRSTHVLEHAQTHHGIPLHTKDARNSTSDSARNSRARHPTRPSKCTISSTVRAWNGTPTPLTYRITLIRCCQGGLGKGGGRKASEDVHGEVPRFLPCILPSTYQVAGKRVYTSCLARKATKFGHFHFNLNFNIYDAQ